MRFVLPIPPSVNAIYKRSAQGRMFMTDEGHDWKDEYAMKLRVASKGSVFGTGEKVVCEVRVWWPDKRRRDMNNLAKLTCDTIQEAGLVEDDKLLLWREMDFGVDKGNPRMELTLYAKES